MPNRVSKPPQLRPMRLVPTYFTATGREGRSDIGRKLEELLSQYPEMGPQIIDAIVQPVDRIRATNDEVNLAFKEVKATWDSETEMLYRWLLELQQAVNDIVTLEPALNYKDLVAISYYGGCTASDSALTLDIADLRDLGYTNLRVWASWWSFEGVEESQSALAASGAIQTDPMNKLRKIVGLMAASGGTVDVTVSAQRFSGFEAHKAGVRNLVTSLRDQSNWFLDLGNEHEGNVSVSQMKELASIAEDLYPDLKYTGSLSGSVASIAAKYEAEIQAGINYAFLTPHFPRTADWFSQARERTEELRQRLAGNDIASRIYLQEEACRRDYVTSYPQPTEEQFIQSVSEAHQAAALGWCFHTLAGFNLSDGRIFDNFDAVESVVVEEIAANWYGAPLP